MQLRTLRIQNYRGITDLELDLDDTTVLMGENNTGKTTILHALTSALERVRSRRGCSFGDYDYHLAAQGRDPTDAPEIAITLSFRDDEADQAPPDLLRDLSDVVQYDDDDRACVTLRVRSCYDSALAGFTQSWEFLNLEGKALQGKGAQQDTLNALQRARPVFYLSAVRDAAREFGQRSQFWAPFLKMAAMDPQLKEQLETEMGALNERVITAHGGFGEVVESLEELQRLVSVGSGAIVSIDALPPRLFEVLSKAQVGVAAATDARLPVAEHGEGTQSLAVLLLFSAFVRARLSSAYGATAAPIIALEEPEAHLHPAAVRSMWGVVRSLMGQKVVATHSGDLLAEVPLSALRRLHRRRGTVVARRPDMSLFTPEDLRKLSYHVAQTRGGLLFARAWLLVEGETDVCVLSEAARILGLSLTEAGVSFVPFQATGGVEPFLKLANPLGIEWHAMVDGDGAGADYAKTMRNYLAGRAESDRISVLPARNMECYFRAEGYGTTCDLHPGAKKPALAYTVMSSIASAGASAVPAFISGVLAKALALAKEAT